MTSCVPFTILTGYLGAGKTTVVNRLLSSAGDRRVAVLVNELGRISIDSKMILSRGGDVLELAGGCVCCKVDTKNDLWDGIADIVARSKPDHVILETTGIAEPQAIVDGFRYLPEEKRDCVFLAGTVCVVEAPAGPRCLRERVEAREQVAFCDRLLLSKLDCASVQQLRTLHDSLDEINKEAERASFPQGEDGSRALVTWLLTTGNPELRPKKEHVHSHSQGQLVAISFSHPTPLVPERLVNLVQDERHRLVRVKGFVNVVGESRRGFLELAGDEISLRYEGTWDGEPRTDLVMIGEALNEVALRRRLWACQAGGATTA